MLLMPSMSTLRYEDITDDSEVYNRLVDYYNNVQKKYVIEMLDGCDEATGGRTNWRERGINPRFRNIFKSIVDKSGQLYNRPPALELWRNNTVFQDPTLNALMEGCDWKAFNQNADVYVRFLKTIVVYLERHVAQPTMTENGQYIFNPDQGDALIPMLLHKGNCQVLMDVTRNTVTELAYLADFEISDDFFEGCEVENEDDLIKYVVVTPLTIEEWAYDKILGDLLVSVEPNPHGIVPAYVRHDTNKPVYDIWNVPALDLLDLQDMYNLQLSDMEYAIAWQKQKTLVTNADIVADEPDATVPRAPRGSTEAGAVWTDMQNQQKGSPFVGLGAHLRLGATDDGTTSTASYIGPDSDLKSLHEIMRELIVDVGNDWDVNLDTATKGSASSGFQLVVREIGNLNLRERRAQYAEAAHRKEYTILRKMYPELPDAQLLVKFPPPSLPVNEKEQQEIWNLKIAANRDSIVGYFMQTENLTEEEAINKAIKIQEFNRRFASAIPATPAGISNNPQNLLPGSGG